MLRDVAGEQVVDADDLVAAVEQGFAEVRADEAGAAGDDDARSAWWAVSTRACGRSR